MVPTQQQQQPAVLSTQQQQPVWMQSQQPQQQQQPAMPPLQQLYTGQAYTQAANAAWLARMAGLPKPKKKKAAPKPAPGTVEQGLHAALGCLAPVHLHPTAVQHTPALSARCAALHDG
jgi:hypothetical protein